MLFYSEEQLTVPVTTNVERAVVDKSEVLQPDSQVDPSSVTCSSMSPTWSRFLLELAASVGCGVAAVHFAAVDQRHRQMRQSVLHGSGWAEAYQRLRSWFRSWSGITWSWSWTLHSTPRPLNDARFEWSYSQRRLELSGVRQNLAWIFACFALCFKTVMRTKIQ